jgi:hypothetical protein
MAAPRTVESTGAANHGERVCGNGANRTIPQKIGAGAAEGSVTPPPVLTRNGSLQVGQSPFLGLALAYRPKWLTVRGLMRRSPERRIPWHPRSPSVCARMTEERWKSKMRRTAGWW